MNNNSQPIKKADIPYPERLSFSFAPHIWHRDTTRSIMLDVIVALLPAFVWGNFVFGIRAFAVVAISVGASVLFEYLFQRLTKRPVRVNDLSAAVCGLILGLNLPAGIPFWMPIAGAFFSIVIVKQLFGGLGKNFLNPALAGYVFLLSFSDGATLYTQPFRRLGLFWGREAIKELSDITPLQALKNGELPDESFVDLLIGRCSGSIGEISFVLLLLGGTYLLVRRVISWHTPVSFIGTVIILTAIFPQNTDTLTSAFVFSHVFSGSLIFGSFFMANDYVTTPKTKFGKLIFGFACGAITVIIRYFGAYTEGVAFAILIMNSLVYYIDELTKPKIFGGVKNG